MGEKKEKDPFTTILKDSGVTTRYWGLITVLVVAVVLIKSVVISATLPFINISSSYTNPLRHPVYDFDRLYIDTSYVLVNEHREDFSTDNFPSLR